jgi:hypothetical protein
MRKILFPPIWLIILLTVICTVALVETTKEIKELKVIRSETENGKA